eukprot:810879-Prymnesium_polylepis.1
MRRLHEFFLPEGTATMEAMQLRERRLSARSECRSGCDGCMLDGDVDDVRVGATRCVGGIVASRLVAALKPRAAIDRPRVPRVRSVLVGPSEDDSVKVARHVLVPRVA